MCSGSVNETFPTPYEDLNAVLRAFTTQAQAILAGGLIGIYLQGSFAAGDFDRHSDVDFTVVTTAEPSDTNVEALNALHERVFRLEIPWAQHLEGSYFPQGLLRDPASCGQPVWYLDHGSRALVRSDHDNTLVVRWVLREHGIALIGPDPATLIDPFSDDALRREIEAVMRGWGAEILKEPERWSSHFYQTFIVLSYCRMLQSLETGKILSKRAGAEWGKAHLDPSWGKLIDRTWAGRPDPAASSRRPADPADFQATLDFVHYAIGLIRRFMPEAREQPPET